MMPIFLTGLPFTGGPRKIAFLASGTSNGSPSVTIPASAIAGDVAFIGAANDIMQDEPTQPTGWTTLVLSSSPTAGIFGKVLSAADITAGTVTGIFDGTNTTERVVILVFRPTFAPSAITAGAAFSSQETSGNPTAQNILAGAATSLPIVSLALYYSDGGVTGKTSTPTMTDVQGTDTDLYFGYLSVDQGATPANISVDTGDGGFNVLQSGYVRVT